MKTLPSQPSWSSARLRAEIEQLFSDHPHPNGSRIRLMPQREIIDWSCELCGHALVSAPPAGFYWQNDDTLFACCTGCANRDGYSLCGLEIFGGLG